MPKPVHVPRHDAAAPPSAFLAGPQAAGVVRAAGGRSGDGQSGRDGCHRHEPVHGPDAGGDHDADGAAKRAREAHTGHDDAEATKAVRSRRSSFGDSWCAYEHGHRPAGNEATALDREGRPRDHPERGSRCRDGTLRRHRDRRQSYQHHHETHGRSVPRVRRPSRAPSRSSWGSHHRERGNRMRQALRLSFVLALSAVVVSAVMAASAGGATKATRVDVNTKHASEVVERGTLPVNKTLPASAKLKTLGMSAASATAAADPPLGTQRVMLILDDFTGQYHGDLLHAAGHRHTHRGVGAEQHQLPDRRLPERRPPQRRHRCTDREPDQRVRHEHVPEGVRGVQRAADP